MPKSAPYEKVARSDSVLGVGARCHGNAWARPRRRKNCRRTASPLAVAMARPLLGPVPESMAPPLVEAVGG